MYFCKFIYKSYPIIGDVFFFFSSFMSWMRLEDKKKRFHSSFNNQKIIIKEVNPIARLMLNNN